MPATHRFAKNRRHIRGRVGQFVSPPVAPQGGASHLPEEQAAYVEDRVAAGLTNIEVTRMFYRKFQKDLSVGSVMHHRKKMSGGEGSLS